MTDIADLALLGDQRTAALVDRTGTVVWMCWPDFADDALLCRLLDPGGGSWSIDAGEPVGRRYLPDSVVLEQRFRPSPSSEVVVTDLLVPPPQGGRWLVRRCEVRGEPTTVRSCLRPTLRFGQAAAPARAAPSGVRFEGSDAAVHLTTDGTVDVVDGGVEVRAEVSEDRPLVMVLGERTPDTGPLREWADNRIRRTADHWHRWVGSLRLPSSAGEVVARSALTVKLLIYEPTGAVVAAPTTSLPEVRGGTRNWDYRYAWLRDASMAIQALERVGRYDEAMAFWDWLERAVRQRNDPPATAYTIHAGEVPAEVGLDHLQGFGGARPVRVGNAASDQLQLDVFGHVLEAAAHCYDRMELDRAHPADVLASFADQAASRWSAPDESIWEVRSGPERYVYSTFRCWSALDRAVHLADEGALAGDRRSWAKAREQAAEAVLRDGWNDELGSFSRAIGGDQLDATALAVVAGGLLERDDPRLVSTIRAVEDHLADGALVRRYATDDGLDGQDGAFLLCSSWLADAHLAAGAPDRAAEILEEVEGLANDLGLLSEEVDLSDRSLLGNFPQALSHLGLINSRVKLDEAAANG